MARRKEEKSESVELCKGVWLTNTFFEKKENRIFTLMLKGFLVYLLTMGSIGFYLSAFNIVYNFVLVHGVIFVMAFVCAGLYYRLLTENIGYLALLTLFGLLVYRYRIVINSGFYAIVNITVDEAARYFDVNVQKLYTEQIENRYLTVTMVAIFIGIVMNILLNVYISRRMQYITAIFITMFVNFIPLYLEAEPDTLYVVMLLVGYAIAIVLKAGKHYSPQIAVRRSDNRFEIKKKEIAYVYDIKLILQMAVSVMLIIVFLISAISKIAPKGTFNQNHKPNKYKEVTMAAMSTFLVDGWQGFFKVPNSIGGINRGKLGEVSSVKLDHMTDLVVQVAPYNYETIYLKQFTGIDYCPYDNYWEPAENTYNSNISPEADALKQAFDENSTNSAKAKMYVKNVGGIPGALYKPYYTKETNEIDMGYTEIVFYPRLKGNDSKVHWEDYGDNKPYSYKDLYIHPDNRDVIDEFVAKVGDTKTEQEFTAALKKYYQDNIPYTVRPGKIPKRKDFVNYFLTEGKKGYCSYFASAAVLAYRAKGIPARYIEGYALGYDQILMGDLVQESKYENVYEGYSELGKTALVKVSVTDADAHAWVEIYNEEEGWHVVDVTPSSSEEEDTEDFWSAFDRILTDEGDGETSNPLQISDELVDRSLTVVFIFVIGLVAVLIVTVSRKHLIFAVKYLRSDVNGKMVLLFGRYWIKQCRRNKTINKNVNYRDQVDALFTYSVPDNKEVFCKAKITDILERAGFSNKKISEDEFEMVKRWMSKTKISR